MSNASPHHRWPTPAPTPAPYNPVPGADGVIRTGIIADPGMAKRVMRDNHLGRLAVWGLCFVTGQALSLIAAYKSDKYNAGAALAFGGLLTLSFLAAVVLFVYGVWSWHRLVRPGTHLVAEFAPTYVAMNYGTRRWAVALSDINSATRHSASLEVASLTRRLLIPLEIVPPHVGAYLVANHNRRGWWRR